MNLLKDTVKYCTVAQAVLKLDITTDAQALFLCLFLPSYADLKPCPIPDLPLSPKMGLKARYAALNELVGRGLVRKYQTSRGFFGEVVDSTFIEKLERMPLVESYNPAADDLVTTSTVSEFWKSQYMELFKQPAPRDAKDLIRFRSVLKRQGGNRALDAVKTFLHERRMAPHKATTLAFFMSYGRAPRVS